MKEMTAEEYLKAKARMTDKCKKTCEKCPLSNAHNLRKIICTELETFYPEEAVFIVQKWAEEHPAKTRQSEFLKMFPNAKLNGGYIDICPMLVDVKLGERCKEYDYYDSCDGCKKDFWREELTEEMKNA